MKLILTDGKTVEVSRVNESMNGGTHQLHIDLSSDNSIDELNEAFDGNSETLTLKKESDNKETTFVGYTNILSIARDITEYSDTLRITLSTNTETK